jgi:hypothetical protein
MFVVRQNIENGPPSESNSFEDFLGKYNNPTLNVKRASNDNDYFENVSSNDIILNG